MPIRVFWPSSFYASEIEPRSWTIGWQNSKKSSQNLIWERPKSGNPRKDKMSQIFWEFFILASFSILALFLNPIRPKLRLIFILLSFRSCLGKKEKEVALVKHELKEAQRKAEQDQEARKKAESERAEIRRKLEDETNRRTKEQNNHVQVRYCRTLRALPCHLL